MDNIVATFTDNKGSYIFDAVAFGDNMLKAGVVTNKTQIRSMVAELKTYRKPQTVIVEIIAGRMWVNVVTRNGAGYSFSVGSRGLCTKAFLIE